MRTDYTQYLVNVDNAMVLCCLDIDYEKDFISVAAGKSTYPIRNVQLSEAERNNSLSVAIIPLKIAFLKGTDMCFFPSRYARKAIRYKCKRGLQITCTSCLPARIDRCERRPL